MEKLTHIQKRCLHLTSPLTPGNGSVQLTQQSPQQTPCPGEEVVYECTVPGNLLRWRIPGESGDRLVAEGIAELDLFGYRSTAGVYDVTNNCFNSTLTFSAQNGISFICRTGDQSMSESVTVAVQGMYSWVYMFVVNPNYLLLKNWSWGERVSG